MSFKQLSTAVVAISLGTCTFASQANNETGYNWAPNHPTSNYWQAPSWSGFNAQPGYNTAPPAYNNSNNYQRPPPQQYRQPPAQNNMNRTAPPPPTGPYSGTAPAPRQNPYQGAPQGTPAPRGQYPQGQYNRPYNGSYNGPSAFNTPGYNPYRNNRGRNNSWNNNKFWGRSGPSTWMSPSKRNWENSWDDMINSPSRAGEMPGGWTAPEVTMPNPIDMGDQMQENAQDLPDQMRDGNIGNDVSN
jgi:hypothetical protein